MIRRYSTNFAIFSIVVDVATISAALFLADVLRPALNVLPFAAKLQTPFVPPALYPIFGFTWVAILLMHSVYDGRRNLYVYDEILNLTIASALAAVSLAGILYLSFRDVSRILFFAFVVLAYISLMGWRLVARVLFRLKQVQPQTRKMLIVGAGPVGQELATKIISHPYFGLQVVGFLDDNPNRWGYDLDILGPIRQARRIITQFKVEDVVIALPRHAYEQVNELSTTLHALPVRVWVIPDYFHLALHKATIDEFAGIPMLDLRAPAINDYQRLIKRALDLLLTGILLVPSLVIMGLIAIALRIEGAGPILFRQERVGENGKLFEMLKFRSMVPDAESRIQEVLRQDPEGRLIHKMADDPRVTRVGRFLRQTSLDELPQIFNVLKGEMSLVGPRPELPFLVEQYEPWQRQRFTVPQGITGWWQVNGRSEKPMHLNTEDDLYYIQNYSLLLDIRIMLKTIKIVLGGKGAY